MDITLKKESGKKFSFIGSNEETTIPICASPQLEAGNTGFRPMELLLVSLAGCLSIDVMLILDKQKQQVDSYEVKVSGERADATPAVFTDIVVELSIKGNVEEEKLKRAITLSEEKYCSVQHSLNPNINIQIKYQLN